MTDSEVACDSNKSTVNDNFGTSNKNTEITEYIPTLQGIDENDTGINYEDDVNNNNCNVNNVNKPSLNDYHLFQCITSQTSNVSLTQLSETSLSNIRTNLDFDSISILPEKRKRILNNNFLTKEHLKSNTLSKVDSNLLAIPHGSLCGSQQNGKINLFKLASETLPSSFSDSSSSESRSERLFKNVKLKMHLH